MNIHIMTGEVISKMQEVTQNNSSFGFVAEALIFTGAVGGTFAAAVLGQILDRRALEQSVDDVNTGQPVDPSQR